MQKTNYVSTRGADALQAYPRLIKSMVRTVHMTAEQKIFEGTLCAAVYLVTKYEATLSKIFRF